MSKISKNISSIDHDAAVEHGEAKTQIEWLEGDMPYSTQFGDTYYSRADGRLECDHVFIRGNKLDQRLITAENFTIAELGFGTGLNFLETARQFRELAPKRATLDFHSFELFPLNKDIMQKALQPWPELQQQTDQLLDMWIDDLSQSSVLQFSDNITLHLHIGEALEVIKHTHFRADCWYLDGFSPAKNQDMWSLDLMIELAQRTKPDGTIASYTAAGWVRRHLVEAGFDISKQRGYAGKRDMIRGVKQANPNN